jgi:general secretion pathway protein G
MQTSRNLFRQNGTSREPSRLLGAAATLANHAAFTLIEIVLVITIISILGAALIYGIKGNVDVAKETRVEADIKAIVTQIKVYEARNLQPPTTEQGIKALVELPTTEPIPERWSQLLEEVPKDPWKHEFHYQHPAKRSKSDYDVYSLGPDGVESADDIGNWKATRKN